MSDIAIARPVFKLAAAGLQGREYRSPGRYKSERTLPEILRRHSGHQYSFQLSLLPRLTSQSKANARPAVDQAT
jgi:hypothetical protein